MAGAAAQPPPWLTWRQAAALLDQAVLVGRAVTGPPPRVSALLVAAAAEAGLVQRVEPELQVAAAHMVLAAMVLRALVEAHPAAPPGRQALPVAALALQALLLATEITQVMAARVLSGHKPAIALRQVPAAAAVAAAVAAQADRLAAMRATAAYTALAAALAAPEEQRKVLRATARKVLSYLLTILLLQQRMPPLAPLLVQVRPLAAPPRTLPFMALPALLLAQVRPLVGRLVGLALL